MNLRHMEVFHAVVEAGSVTGAAKILNVTQPAVTNMLKHLEYQTGLRLFERVKGRLEPTPEARLIFNETSRVFDQVDAVRRVIEDVKNLKTGLLEIACTPLISRYLMPQILGSFSRLHPHIKLRLHVREQRETSSMVARGLVDFGVTILSKPNPRINRSILATGEVVVAVPDESPLAGRKELCAEDLSGQRMITYNARQGLTRRLNEIILDAGIQVNSVCEVSTIDNAIDLVRENVGLALADNIVHENYIKGLSYLKFVPSIPIEADLLEPTKLHRTLPAESFHTHLMEFLASSVVRREAL